MVQDTMSRRFRRSFRVRAERVLDRLGLVEPRPEPAVVWSKPPVVAAAPVVKTPVAAPAAKVADSAGGMTFAAVQEVFDDMVRPALQSDGGDISLHEVVDGEVRVSLVGACHTCPSSTMTMKLGVERLLEEEFEDFVALVQVGG